MPRTTSRNGRNGGGNGGETAGDRQPPLVAAGARNADYWSLILGIVRQKSGCASF